MPVENKKQFRKEWGALKEFLRRHEMGMLSDYGFTSPKTISVNKLKRAFNLFEYNLQQSEIITELGENEPDETLRKNNAEFAALKDKTIFALNNSKKPRTNGSEAYIYYYGDETKGAPSTVEEEVFFERLGKISMRIGGALKHKNLSEIDNIVEGRNLVAATEKIKEPFKDISTYKISKGIGYGQGGVAVLVSLFNARTRPQVEQL